MLGNIVVASDGSEASERMIECVRGFFAALDYV